MSATKKPTPGKPPRGGSAQTDPRKDTAESERRRLDQELDHALEESFPGSDPVNLAQPAHSPSDRDDAEKRKDKSSD